MGREFTVYGLRFSKTSFWNHVNTGFLDPAVATALTACGIETEGRHRTFWGKLVATALTACGIETTLPSISIFGNIRCNSAYRLRY